MPPPGSQIGPPTAPGPGPRARALLCLALLAVAPAGVGAGAAAAQAPSAADTVTVDSAALARADSIRAAMERPPNEHGTDAVEVLEFPFEVALFPVVQTVRFAAAAAGLASMRDPPPPVTAIRDARRWGLVPRIQAVGPNSGAALVLDLRAFEPFFFETGISVVGSQRHRAGLRWRGGKFGGRVSYTFRRDAEDEFWGIGGDTPRDQRSDFLRDKQEVEASGRVRPAEFLSLRAGVAYEDNRVEDGFDGRLPDISETFDPDRLVGLGERMEFGRADLGVTLDFTRRTGFRRRGLELRLGGSVFRGVDGTPTDFHRLDHEIVGYLPLNSRQALALRGLVQINELDAGPGIPFYDLARFGGPLNGPRSFEGGRFRARDGLSLMAEWRYAIWEGPEERQRMEAFLLFDEGAVGRSLTELGSENFHESFGFGLRALTDEGVVGAGWVAFGEEGPTFGAQTTLPF